VLFAFFSERYERRNLVLSEWGQFVKNPLMTTPAIDRVICHGIIIEFDRDIKSVRIEKSPYEAT